MTSPSLRPASWASASMDVFYTAALDGIIKLWDLRSMQDMMPCLDAFLGGASVGEGGDTIDM